MDTLPQRLYEAHRHACQLSGWLAMRSPLTWEQLPQRIRDIWAITATEADGVKRATGIRLPADDQLPDQESEES